MCRSVESRGNVRKESASYGKQKEGAGPSFLVGCIWDDR